MNPAERARQLYRDRFATDPVAVATAPGRVNLIGEHIDYHGGHVLPMAVRERTAVAVGPGAGRFRAVSEHGEYISGPWPPVPARAWSDYVAGVAWLSLGGEALSRGLCVAVASDLPIGAGLSSSAALAVAAAAALAAMSRRKMEPLQCANLAYRAETEFVGVPCGRMDQLASAMALDGTALLINCRTEAITPVPVGVDLVVAESGQTRDLRDSAYAERRREGIEAFSILRTEVPAIGSLVDIPPARLADLARGLPDTLVRRVRHVVNENQRAILAARALSDGDFDAFGTLVNASHYSLRDLYECSTERLDRIVEYARALPHALGARMVGAGWGGSVLVIAEPGAGHSVAARLRHEQQLALPAVREVAPGHGVRIEIA